MPKQSDKPTTLLCILDGLGLNENPEGNAFAAADTPTLDSILHTCPAATLKTHSQSVGLPEGQMGNSEVGHLNIGAGRVVEQWLMRIGRELQDGSLDDNAAYQSFLKQCQSSPRIHLIGLYSDGGVHSHKDHLHLLLADLRRRTSAPIALHIVTDGRDTSPTGFLKLLPELEQQLTHTADCSIATISGRFYAMDRDQRWERIEQAYRVIAEGKGPSVDSLSAYVEHSYAEGTTDEFIEPASIDSTPIGPEDTVLFWNFRADRMREIVKAVALEDFSEFSRGVAPTGSERTICFTDYDDSYKLPHIFTTLSINNHLGAVVAAAGLTQLRTAETEKYPHVTYFLNGGIETPCPGEDRQIVPSPRDVKTYDLKPEMSARGVCDIVLKSIQERAHDLIVVNFANCDMVGHTGVLSAATKAVETVDACLGEILSALEKVGGQAIIIADHGNAEQMINYDDGSPHTAHTTFPVPVVLVGTPAGTTLKEGMALCDVAPTVLKMMGLDIPEEMTGTPIF